MARSRRSRARCPDRQGVRTQYAAAPDQAFIRFRNSLWRDIQPGGWSMSSSTAHKHVKARAWLKRRPRRAFHCRPDLQSLVPKAFEDLFAIHWRCRLKKCVSGPVVDLRAAINLFNGGYNRTPKPSSPRRVDGSKRSIQSTRGARPLGRTARRLVVRCE